MGDGERVIDECVEDTKAVGMDVAAILASEMRRHMSAVPLKRKIKVVCGTARARPLYLATPEEKKDRNG